MVTWDIMGFYARKYRENEHLDDPHMTSVPVLLIRY